MSGSGPLPPAYWKAGLDLIYAQEDPDQQIASVESGLQRLQDEPASRSGLLGIWDEQGPRLAAWLVPGAGHSAMLGSPGVDEQRVVWSQDAPTLVALVTDWLSQHGIRWCQSLFSGLDTSRWGPSLIEAGFEQPAELDYLFLDVVEAAPQQVATEGPAPGEWISAASLTHEELERLVEQTFVGTLDCPFLQAHRSTADVVAGFFQSGISGNEHWRCLTCRGELVGCLLATIHRPQELIEWVYVGLRPEFRGKGWGQELCRGGHRQAIELGCPHVVLAVDAANMPAQRLYRRYGFTPWARRTLFVKWA